MTKQTVWDLFSARKFRLGGLFLGAGVVGVVLVAVVLKVPLGIALLFMLAIGSFGVTSAVFEMIVRAVANSRAKITFRPHEPFEFLRLSKGFLNVTLITYVHCASDGSLVVSQTDSQGFTLEGDDASQLTVYLNEISTPLWAMATSEEKPEFPNGEFDNGGHWRGEA